MVEATALALAEHAGNELLFYSYDSKLYIVYELEKRLTN
jgi:hypothetical protein